MTKLVGVHHVGVPVQNLERSLAFYEEVFGLTPSFREHFEGPGLDTVVQVESSRIDAAYIKVGESMLELLHYAEPAGAPFQLRNCDVGAIHVGFEVDDIDAMHRKLEARGIAVNAPPGQIAEGPLAGHKSCYFRDPDGIQFELFQRPSQ